MRIIKEDKLNYSNSDMKKLRNAVRRIVVDNDEQFIDLVDSILNNEPINYVPETRKLKNAIDSAYVDSDEELRELVLDVAVDQGVISRSINESKDIQKDLNDVIDFKKGFSNFDSLEKYLRSRGYEVADYNADHGSYYIDIVGIGDKYDGYRYAFDFDDMSDHPDGRFTIGSFIDRDKE